jgi:hypothetical protein
MTMRPPQQYSAPTLVVIGPVSKLTMVIKQFNSSDGLTYMGTSIGNASV